MLSPSVAIIDIGSNSIKILVAQRGADGRPLSLKYKTLEVRISTGISKARPSLSEEGMARGLAAIQELLADAAAFVPAKIALVATSAVRDATNGGEFKRRVLEATGHPIRILTGEEEADYIGRGLTCDPALANLQDFYVFDLGGGSLECLSFIARRIRQEKSLQLGCVRLTELCVPDPTQPFSHEAYLRVCELTKNTLEQSGFTFDLPPTSVAVATGGTLVTARAVLGARSGKALADTATYITLSELRDLLHYVGRCNLADRRRLPAIPHGRADVFPTALATVIALAEKSGFAGFQTSLYNLRWGMADELLRS